MTARPTGGSGNEHDKRGAVVRAAAARLLAACSSWPYRAIEGLLADADASPATRELVFGVLRHYFSLLQMVNSCLAKPMGQRDQDVLCLLLVGAYQLSDAHTPAHVAVNETVEATRNLGKPWASGLVNGVLRSLQRLHGGGLSLSECVVDLPDWLAKQIHREYRAEAGTLFRAFLGRPPMTLRINTLRQSPEEYRSLLDAIGIQWKTLWLEESVCIDPPLRQQDLPGYAEGAVSVQDAAAQFAARLLSVPAGARVLDTCAAPGGKLFHLMERHPDAEFFALESSSERLTWLHGEATRLGHTQALHLHETDARSSAWWDGRTFDRVLLDAPCTGTGTLRRHPDIKLHREEGDAIANQQLQRELLEAAWRFLSPGGLLLYVTCSILEVENDGVIRPFLAATADATVAPVQLPTGVSTDLGWQTLPSDPHTDGLYFALLRKR